MKCIHCNKEINLNIYKSNKFCSAFCCMQAYQFKTRRTNVCMVCGASCYSKHRICLNCLKLNKTELRRKLNEK